MRYSEERSEFRARDFDAFWAPSYRGSDIWQVQGVLRDKKRRFVDFVFRAQLMRINSGSNSYSEAYVTLIDRMNHHSFCKRIALPGRHVDIEKLYVDEDCILCGELLQMMLFDGRDIALRTRMDGLGLDLRLNRRYPECWFGGSGLMPLGRLLRQYKCTLPQLAVTGRVYAGKSSIVVQGNASLQHYQGDIVLQNDKLHWDRFELLMNNGEQISITAMPRAGYGTLEIYPTTGRQTVAEQFTLNHTETRKAGVFSYPSEWTLHIPQYAAGDLTLRVEDYPQLFAFPVPRPLLAVYDRGGRQVGCGVAELLPGAVAEQPIEMKLFVNDK